MSTTAKTLLESTAFQAARKNLLDVIGQATASIRKIRAPQAGSAGTNDLQSAYARTIETFCRNRGLDIFYPYLSSGIGSGPFVELADGSVKMDLISGIGINFFGHSHPELMAEMIQAVPSDPMHGNLQPGHEAEELISEVLASVGGRSRLKHGWLMCSGTMVNEFALKMIRQKHAPATKVLAFKDCFAGRSTALQEITDGAGLREGQPTYDEVYYLPFYDAKLGLTTSIDATLTAMRSHFNRYPGKICALMLEIVQGEGGFKHAPKEWYIAVFEEARSAGLAVWADEIQTFGRTGELFAYQTFGLDEYVDVVTIGKLLQACMVLYTPAYKPRPGLIGGTFSGSAVALRTGRRILQMLKKDGYLGREGKIEKLSARFVSNLKRLSETTCQGLIGEVRAVGGMIAFVPFSGELPEVKDLLKKLFHEGVVAYYCGHGPHLVRLLPPLGAMTEQEVDLACEVIEKVLLEAKRS